MCKVGVKINASQVSTSSGSLFRVNYRKGVGHHHLPWQRLKGREGEDKLLEKEREGSACALTGAPGGGLRRSRHPK